MAEVITPPPLSPLPYPDRPTSLGRPLSEISDNEILGVVGQRSRTGSRSSKGSRSRPLSEVRQTSRPTSEHLPTTTTTTSSPILDSTLAPPPKRLSAPPIHTLSLNLKDYVASLSTPPEPLSIDVSPTPAPPSPISKSAPPKPEKPVALRSPSSPNIKASLNPTADEAITLSPPVILNTPLPDKSANQLQSPPLIDTGSLVEDKSEPPETQKTVEEEVQPAGHPLLTAQRALLKPSPLRPNFSGNSSGELSASSTQTSFESARSSIEKLPAPPPKPPTKSKPSWLRRASGTAVFRSKSKTPPPQDVSIPEGIPTSTSLPPALPPRKGLLASTSSSSSSTTSTSGDKLGSMGPPELPLRPSPNSSSGSAGPSRSRLGGGQGQPAYLPSTPVPPTREFGSGGGVRNKIAAWGGGGFSRSESSSTLSFSAPGAFQTAQQKLPASAQKLMGQAGSAVSKGLAGLRARGVGGSISNMSALASGTRRTSMEQIGPISRTGSAKDSSNTGGDGPFFPEGSILRVGGQRTGRVFGRDISEAGRAWCIVDPNVGVESKWEQRRRATLPAIVVRSVEYLELWGPKEEGIFRVSGRNSHIARLRKEFDSGGDIDLTGCDPGDLDPHAVSGIFKSYLRELPEPILTYALTSKFESAVRGRISKPQAGMVDLSDNQESLGGLLAQLPSANWFLLADIIKLLDLIPRHTATNRMNLNAVMLSLGPSLNLPGPVLTAFLERREELFSTPPADPLFESTAFTDAIDFGDMMIPPPVIPAAAQESSRPPSRSSTPLSVDSVDKDRRSSKRLPSKPSLQRLFTAASLKSGSDPKSASETPRSSIVADEAPRVDVGLDSPRLPSFETDQERANSVTARIESTEQLLEPVVIVPLANEVIDKHNRSSSTPIADIYATAHTSTLAPLRGPGSSTPSSPLFPNTQFTSEWSRKPSSSFFNSSERHVRSKSASTTPTTSPIVSSGSAMPATMAVSVSGMKRKEESKSNQERDSENRVKRLSAGPGSLDLE